ncbi:hypothetical protein T08_12116 [Trichinella sp. T8]|nr:hypothetical protein T08_12116 [Trichinella sp. T8]
MLSRDKTENNFGVAFFCTEHIHFCSFFGKLHIVLGHMIGGSARTKSGVLLVTVTVALGGFLRMASRAINGCSMCNFQAATTAIFNACCIRGQLRILAFRTVPVAFIHLCNRGVDLIVSVRYDPKKLSRAALILKDYLVSNT